MDHLFVMCSSCKCQMLSSSMCMCVWSGAQLCKHADSIEKRLCCGKNFSSRSHRQCWRNSAEIRWKFTRSMFVYAKICAKILSAKLKWNQNFTSNWHEPTAGTEQARKAEKEMCAWKFKQKWWLRTCHVGTLLSVLVRDLKVEIVWLLPLSMKNCHSAFQTDFCLQRTN